MEITVEELDETTFKVSVTNGTTTTHTVTVTKEYCRKLTGGNVLPGNTRRKVIRVPPQARAEHQHPARLRPPGDPTLLRRLRENHPLLARVIRCPKNASTGSAGGPRYLFVG
jgi:hypothetical protein